MFMIITMKNKELNMDLLTDVVNNLTAIQTILYISLLVLVNQVPLITKVLVDKSKKKKAVTKVIGRELKPIIELYVDNQIKIDRLKESILPCQMVVVDKSVIRIKSFLMDNYKNMDAPAADISHYDHILYKTLSIAKDTLRDWLRLNHILEKSDIEFREYVRDIKDLITKEHISLLDREYNSEYFTISRKELFESNKKHTFGKIDDILEEMMHKVRDTARDIENQIYELDSKSNIFMGCKDEDDKPT